MGKKSESIYLDLWDYDDPAYPFQIFVGAYGAGKSFSALRGAIERKIDWIYLRRTKEAFTDCCTSPKGDTGNPFAPLNDTLGWNIGIHKMSDKMAGIYERETDEHGMPVPTGEILGKAMYLGGLAKVRGAGLESAQLILYDEFIKEMHEPKMRGEFKALMRGYETINRNKEFRGEPPTRLWCISNAEDIYNELFVGLGIVSEAEKMARKSQEHKYFKERGLALHLLHSNPEFIKKKSQTAIMKLMAGTQYADVGLNNQFANNDFSLVEYRRLIGYRPIVGIDQAYVYQKKGQVEYYVSYAETRCERYTAKTVQDERLFRRRWAGILQEAFTHGKLFFESYELKEFILEHIF